MKLFALFICFVIALSAFSDAYAGQVVDRILKKGELVVGTAADNPPMSMKTKEGKIIGFDADIAELIASAMGVKLKMVQINFNDLLDALTAGKIDLVISNMTMVPQRNLKAAFAGPYYISGMTLLTKDNLAKEIRNLKDIKGDKLKVAVSKGTTNEMLAKDKISPSNIVPVKSEDEAISLLIEGKVSGVLTDGGAAIVAAYRNKDKNLILSRPLTFEPIGIALPADDSLLLNWVENYIRLLKSQQKLEDMYNKWADDPSWVKLLP